MTPQVSFSDATFRAIFDSAVQGIIAVDKSGCIELANPMAEQLFGYLPGELTGIPVETLIPQRLRRAHERDRADYVARPRSRPMGIGKELIGLKKDGSEFSVEVSLNYAHDASLAIAFVTDVTERKRLEHERGQFFNLAPDLMCITSAEGIVLNVNPAFEECLGYSVEEATGRSYTDFVHSDDLNDVRAAERSVRQGNELRHFRDRCVTKDGSSRWLEWTSRAVPGPELLIYSVARDVTANVLLERQKEDLLAVQRTDEERLRALTAQLLKVQEEERRRIARELHDGPTQDLALLAAEMGQLQKKLGAEHQEECASLHARVLTISEEVRVLAHEFHPSVLEHSGLAAALDAYCREMSRLKDIAVHFVVDQDLGEIPKSVAVSLYRIAQEALHNVTKHSNATAATVALTSVKLAAGKRGLRLAVIDDGKGFLMDQVRNGSGLGLVNIEERARLVQGILRISSVPGEGTRVEVEVPLPEESA